MSEKLIQRLTLPENVKQTMVSLSEPVDLDSLDYFTTELACYYEELRTRVDYNEVVDINLVDRIYETALDLLRIYPERSAEEQSLIIAGIRSFVIDEEEDADLEHPYAFETDAKVFDEIFTCMGIAREKIL